MSKGFKKLLILVLTVALVLSAAATGIAATTTKAPATPAVDHKTTYTIDCFTMRGNYSGEQTGYAGKILKDKFNIKMNIISSNVEGGGDAKFATMMASGNLGDLVVFGSDNDGKYTDAIKAGFILDMTKNDLLNKYAPYVTKNFPKVIQKAKANFGKGKAVYGFGFQAADAKNTGPSEGIYMGIQPNFRFDLYQKIGSPEIKTFEDMLPVLKKMQQAQPKSDTGKPTYAFSFWKDWDGNMMMNTKAFTYLMGYDEGDGLNDGGFMQFSPTGTSYGCLDPKGPYVRTLKLFNKANQMGLVDPDSISQTFTDVSNKYKDGQILFSEFWWLDNNYNTDARVAAGKGFQMVPIKEQKIVSLAFNNYGDQAIIAIGSKAKKPERILEFINWLYTPEGMEVYKYGPKGLAWDLDSKGKPYVTDYGVTAMPNKLVPVPKRWGGGDFQNGAFQINFNDPINFNSVNPMFGEPYNYELWNSQLIDNPSTLIKNWRAKYKVLTPKDYVVKNNQTVLKKAVYTGKAPEQRPSELVQKQGQAASVIKEYSWKCIFAKNDAEFNDLLKEGTDKATGLGYKDVVKWNLDHAKQVTDFLKTQK